MRLLSSPAMRLERKNERYNLLAMGRLHRCNTNLARNAMNDIVEQLRLAHAWFDVDSDATVPVARKHGMWLFKTAADEIVAHIGNAENCYKEWKKAQSEIERLREALEKIEDQAIRCTLIGTVRPFITEFFSQIAQIARAALGEKR
jgi:hypothetical protein